ncbi:MAG: 4-hydroxy-tetrahydrodipicolinate reductase [Gaiellaceae bacterium]
MARVCVAGITGWTGGPIAEAIAAAEDLELVGGVSRSGAGTRLPALGVPVFASVREAIEAVAADVVVDYTDAAAVKENVLAALSLNVAVVVGSSGLTAADFDEIDARAREAGVGVIAAGNFSLLAALLLRSAAETARFVGSWEIIDYASAAKPDVPSGTSRELAERLGETGGAALGRELDSLLGPVEARGATVAGSQVHSVRLPSFVVSTEIVFASEGERLTLRHDPGESPAPYVAGTLLAIRSVRGRVGLTRGLDALID